MTLQTLVNAAFSVSAIYDIYISYGNKCTLSYCHCTIHLPLRL